MQNGVMGIQHALSSGLGAHKKVKELVMEKVTPVCLVFVNFFECDL